MDFSQISRQSAFRRMAEGMSSDESDRPRPKSRRGNHEPVMKYNSQDSDNKKNIRPSSAYRSDTASRLSTSSFGVQSPVVGPAKHNTSNFYGVNMMDRPITQQGLSGIRTTTGIGRNRQLKDRRYWEEVLNTRIKALKLEINRLQKIADTATREKSANKHYEARGRELAQELTDLQGRLMDYNIAAQMLSTSDIAAIQNQTKELQATNNKLQNDVEHIFIERQNKESQLKQLLEQLNKEKNTIDLLLKDMTSVEKSKYLQLRDSVMKSQNESDQIKIQIEELSQIKDDLEKQISVSQMKTHMMDMLKKLALAEEKRDSLKNEMNNKLQPAQERDQLLIQVREDNASISSMESNTHSIKEDIKRIQEQLEQAEQDLEEGQSERHQKYRELKRREETMESFMISYEQNKEDEKRRISQLESDIVFSLEHMSSNTEQLNFDEIDLLKQKNGSGNTVLEVENDKSIETLIKEYERHEVQMKRSNDMYERVKTELKNLPERISTLKQSIDMVSNLENLKTEGTNRKKMLLKESDMLKDKLLPTENAVREAENKYRELQRKLDGNEMYAHLNAMEEKLSDVESTNTALRNDIASITIRTDYEPLKLQVFDLITKLHGHLSITPKNFVY